MLLWHRPSPSKETGSLSCGYSLRDSPKKPIQPTQKQLLPKIPKTCRQPRITRCPGKHRIQKIVQHREDSTQRHQRTDLSMIQLAGMQGVAFVRIWASIVCFNLRNSIPGESGPNYMTVSLNHEWLHPSFPIHAQLHRVARALLSLHGSILFQSTKTLSLIHYTLIIRTHSSLPVTRFVVDIDITQSTL